MASLLEAILQFVCTNDGNVSLEDNMMLFCYPIFHSKICGKHCKTASIVITNILVKRV